MKELEKFTKEKIETLNINDSNTEIHIKYVNEKTLIIGSNGSGPLTYVIANSKLELIESSPVFEEDLSKLLNFEIIKSIDHLTLSVFKVKTDHKKSTLIGLTQSSPHIIVRDMLILLADLHSFFNKRGGYINLEDKNLEFKQLDKVKNNIIILKYLPYIFIALLAVCLLIYLIN